MSTCTPRLLCCLFAIGILVVGTVSGCFSSKSQKIPTTQECNKLINDVSFKCYESALKKRSCGTPATKTVTVFSRACQTCTGCIVKAQECMVKDLKKGTVSKCPQAQQSVISLERILKQ
ncbi:hypothetical protein FGIG_12185 [Fasciola gigantica]|uniref:Uncharacterized protein n=1 Tax=Fasciola gigantica TaxID=46835 RepID=A0A504YDR8_FASGI|nr:hypothetical protein FGIG_12185 [Fasciola gigantica]